MSDEYQPNDLDRGLAWAFLADPPEPGYVQITPAGMAALHHLIQTSDAVPNMTKADVLEMLDGDNPALRNPKKKEE